MCIIAAIPTGVAAPSDDILKRCWDRNSDFCGFMFVDDDANIAIQKFTTFEAFLPVFHTSFKEYGSRSPFVIHFRLASHGSVSLANTHPFLINKRIAFCHNGTINQAALDQKIPGQVKSDTVKFMEYILKELPDKFEEDEEILDLIYDYVSPSRLVFLTNEKKLVYLYGKNSSANEQDGVWYSTTIPAAIVKKEKKLESFEATFYFMRKNMHLLKCEMCGTGSTPTDDFLMDNSKVVAICSECQKNFGISNLTKAVQRVTLETEVESEEQGEWYDEQYYGYGGQVIHLPRNFN